MKHGSFWSVSLLFASYCIWQVEISYPISLPSNQIDLYLSEISMCPLYPFSVANTLIRKESYFRINVCWDIINVQRKQQGTKDSALWPWDTWQNRGPTRFCSVYNNSLLSVGHSRSLYEIAGLWFHVIPFWCPKLRRSMQPFLTVCKA